MGKDVADAAIQVHGGYGYMRESRVEQLMRDAKILQIYAGTDEMQIIAIARDFQRAGELALVTRVDEAKAAAISQAIPELVHHSQARCA